MADSPEEYPFKPILIPVQQSQVFPMNTRLLYAAIIFALFSIVSASAAQQGQDAIAKCDRLAASQLDPMRPPSVPGVPFDQVDGAAAVKACTEAFTKNPGNARIEFELARALQRAHAPPERVAALYQHASDRGSLLAAHNLANEYMTGDGVPRDQAEATRLFRAAAEGGIPLSMGVLAGRLERGDGTQKNEAEALRWRLKAANRGDVSSMEALVNAYAIGHPELAADDREARRWLDTSAKAGSASSAKLLTDVKSLDAQSITEVVSLEKRLADDKCYAGAVDGKPTVALGIGLETCPNSEPQLRIETGMHLSRINQISTDAQCHLASTGSTDKTVRLWSLPDGKLLRTLRVPIDNEGGGEIRATALSPDGRFVAAGGADVKQAETKRHSVYIFDAASGAVIARPSDYGSGIARLAFSRDGRWLAAGLGEGGLRLIDTVSWQEIAADKNYRGAVSALAFGSDGTLYTMGGDGKLRRYAPGRDLALEHVELLRGRSPGAIAIAPANDRIVISYESFSTAINDIEFYDAKTFAFIGKADTQGIEAFYPKAVAWQADGHGLIVGGSDDAFDSNPYLVSFDREGRRFPQQPTLLSKRPITDVQSCGRGYALAALEPALGLLDNTGKPRFWRTGESFDMRFKLGEAFALSADAKRIRFGFGRNDTRSLVFDLLSSTVSDGERVPVGFRIPDVTSMSEGLIEEKRDPYWRALAIAPDHSGFVGLWTYFFVAKSEGKTRWVRSAPGTGGGGVNFSADSKIVVAAYYDGTIRWHRWSDGQELLALFVNRETKAWVAWTPTGYYSASAGGEDMIGWQVNRGRDQAADFYPASRFHDQFARPDIVERVLDTLDETEAIKQANAARGGRTPETVSIVDHLPPVVSILSPADGATVNGEVSVEYLIRSPSGLPVDSVEALIDGRPVPKGRGLGRLGETDTLTQCLTQTRGLGRVENALQGCRGQLSVTLPPGASELGLFARSGERSGEVVRIRLTRSVAPSATEAQKPKLYALIIGISAYLNHDYALGYPAKDAHDFAAALINQKGGLYSDVELQSLTDDKATERAIKDGFDWLQHRVTNRDTGVIYLAGHGMLDERDRFYFIAADSDAARLRATAVSREEISDALDALQGKALLFLDACHAGGMAKSPRGKIDINTVVNDFSRGEHGVVVFAASTGRQESQENAAWNNGAFTKAVVEGIGLPGDKPKADFLGNGTITTSELDAYITNRVKSLTSGEQTPVMIRPPTVPDFSLASAR